MFRAFVAAAAVAAVLGASFAIAKSSGGNNAGGALTSYGGKASSISTIGVKPPTKLSKNVDETAFCELMREKYGPGYSRRGCEAGN